MHLLHHWVGPIHCHITSAAHICKLCPLIPSGHFGATMWMRVMKGGVKSCGVERNQNRPCLGQGLLT